METINPPRRCLASAEHLADALRLWRSSSGIDISATNTVDEFMSMIPIECGRRICPCGGIARVFYCTAARFLGNSHYWLEKTNGRGYLTLEIKKCFCSTEVQWAYDSKPPGNYCTYTQTMFDFDRAVAKKYAV